MKIECRNATYKETQANREKATLNGMGADFTGHNNTQNTSPGQVERTAWGRKKKRQDTRSLGLRA